MKHSHPERKRGISHDYYETLHPPPNLWFGSARILRTNLVSIGQKVGWGVQGETVELINSLNITKIFSSGKTNAKTKNKK